MDSPPTALAPHASALREALATATLSNCVAVARALLELAAARDLPPTHQVVPLRLDKKTPCSRAERQAARMVLPLRSEAKQRLGLEADDFCRFPAWPYHVTTEFVAEILVDCLTGDAGTAIEIYLETFFEYAEYLDLVEFDVMQEDEPV